MPQERQKRKIVYDSKTGQVVIEGEDTNPTTQPATPADLTSQQTASGQPVVSGMLTPPGHDTNLPKDFLPSALKAIAVAAPMTIPGGGLPAMALRSLISAGVGGATAAAEGEDPIGEAAFQATLGAGGEGVGKAVGWLGNRLALLAGGSLHRKTGLDQAAKAFERDAERRGVPVFVGQKERTNRLLDQAGVKLEKAENAAPGQARYRDVVEDANQAYRADAVNTANPQSLRMDIDSFNAQTIIEQAIARHPQLSQMAPEQAMRTFKRLPAQVQEDIIENTFLNARQLGELERGNRGTTVKNVIQARKNNQLVPESEAQSAQMRANLNSELRGNRLAMDAIPAQGRKVGDVKRAMDEFSDLSTMKSANAELRTDPSIYAIRAALGGQAGGAIGALTGMGYGQGMMLGSAAGAAADPRLVSIVSWLAQKASKHFPAAYRTADFYNEMKQAEEKVRLRKPKGDSK